MVIDKNGNSLKQETLHGKVKLVKKKSAKETQSGKGSCRTYKIGVGLD